GPEPGCRLQAYDHLPQAPASTPSPNHQATPSPAPSIDAWLRLQQAIAAIHHAGIRVQQAHSASHYRGILLQSSLDAATPEGPWLRVPRARPVAGPRRGQAGNKVKPTTTTTEEPSEGLSLDAAGLQALQDKNEDGQYHPDADHTHWDIRKSIPGEPGTDYPTLDSIPETGFSCDGRADGYYADVSTRCQVYHVCSSQAVPVKNSFMCNNGSIFNQERFVCDWWPNVDCPNSERSFDLNLEIGKTPNAQGGSADAARQASYSGSKAASSNAYSSGSFQSASLSSDSNIVSANFKGGSAAVIPPKAAGSAGSSFSASGSDSGIVSTSFNGGSASVIPPKSGTFAVAPSSSNGIDNDDSLAASLSSSLPSGASAPGASAPAEEPPLSSSLDDNSLYRQNAASSASSASSEGALSYPGPSAGFSADIATAGIDLRSGFSSSGRLSPAATSSLRASFARSAKQVSAADEAVVAAGSSQAAVRFGERLPGARSGNANNANNGPAKDLEAPGSTFKRRRYVVTRRRRVPVHEKRAEA
ncbi:uncharacterized protein LOC117642950, partial [Thrips palmi]|uniref:Uncharacterized protein LOC117642950 n=1 Tax=Thrips palmi TaxID=161013 RepID=A0A6P8YCT4_THRPL